MTKISLLALAVIGMALVSASAGQIWILPWHLAAGAPDSWILWELRAPRVVLAAGIGALLGLSGAVLQGMTRNPLADSGVLGISACAALGAVLAIFFEMQSYHPLAIPMAAILGALLGLLILGALIARTSSMLSFLLGGLMLASLAGALTALVISLAPTPFASSEIITWLLGSLTDRSWGDAVFALPLMAAGAALLLLTGRALDALSLGEPVARSLGISLRHSQALALTGVALGVGAAVAVCGIIGFVGLIVPHLMRRLVGETPSALLLPSALGGALLLMAADMTVRLLPTAAELKLGIVLSLVGAPAFILILLKHRRDLP